MRDAERDAERYAERDAEGYAESIFWVFDFYETFICSRGTLN